MERSCRHSNPRELKIHVLMNSIHMKLVLYEYVYSLDCKITEPEVLEHSYGEFLLRKRNGPGMRYLNALEDDAYQEVSEIIKGFFPNVKFESSDLLQIVFGPVACDPDIDGKPFEMNLAPYCETCDAAEPLSWQMTEPPVFVYIEVPLVKHDLWNSLSPERKRNRVLDFLKLQGFRFN